MGRALRGWLDLPDDEAVARATEPARQSVERDPDDLAARHVLADALMERGDPEGEMISLSLSAADHGTRVMELVRAHYREWLGPLSRVVTESGAVFERGLLTQVAAYFPPDGVDLGPIVGASEWSTVRSLTLLPQSKEVLGATMQNLHRLGPIGGDGVIELVAASRPWQLRELSVRAEPGVLDLLAEAHERLLDLRRLVMISAELQPPSECEAFLSSPLGKRLEALMLGASPPTLFSGTTPFLGEALAAWLATPMHVPSLLGFGATGDLGWPAGPWLYVRRASPAELHAFIEVPALDASTSIEVLGRAIGALPTDVLRKITAIELRPSRWFVPTTADVARLFETSSLQATLVER